MYLVDIGLNQKEEIDVLIRVELKRVNKFIFIYILYIFNLLQWVYSFLRNVSVCVMKFNA